MRKTLIAVGFTAISSLLALSGPAAAQGFGQVTIASAPAAPSADPAKPPAAHSVDGVTVTGQKQAEVDKNPNEVICHSEPVMGSLFPRKVCASRRELAERRANDQEVARKFSGGIQDGSGNTH